MVKPFSLRQSLFSRTAALCPIEILYGFYSVISSDGSTSKFVMMCGHNPDRGFGRWPQEPMRIEPVENEFKFLKRGINETEKL
jgi:hypothetical protein